jgi:hypothetical protein
MKLLIGFVAWLGATAVAIGIYSWMTAPRPPKWWSKK